MAVLLSVIQISLPLPLLHVFFHSKAFQLSSKEGSESELNLDQKMRRKKVYRGILEQWCETCTQRTFDWSAGYKSVAICRNIWLQWGIKVLWQIFPFHYWLLSGRFEFRSGEFVQAKISSSNNLRFDTTTTTTTIWTRFISNEPLIVAPPPKVDFVLFLLVHVQISCCFRWHMRLNCLLLQIYYCHHRNARFLFAWASCLLCKLSRSPIEQP